MTDLTDTQKINLAVYGIGEIGAPDETLQLRHAEDARGNQRSHQNRSGKVNARKTPITDEAIGALIRAKRHARGMGQPALGEALGVTEQMVQKYETGASALKVTTLVKIAETLGCKTLDLIP